MMISNTNTAMADTPPESALLDNLLRHPTRMNFRVLAAHYEELGDKKSASEAYLGVLPSSTKEKYELERGSLMAPLMCSGVQRLVRYIPESVKLQSPLYDDKKRNKVFDLKAVNTKPSFLDIFSDAVVETDGVNKLFQDNKGHLVAQHSTVNHCLIPNHPDYSKTNETVFKGLTVSLLARNGHNFYHWFVDVISQLELLESAGINVSEVDRFVFSKSDSKFQRESLSLLGIPASKILSVDGKLHRFKFEKIAVPFQINSMGRSMSPRVLSFLRRRYLPHMQVPNGIGKKIAIERTKRGVANAQECNQKLNAYGFQSVRLEDFSLQEQIGLFYNASAVFAPHGAGLMSSIFAKPNTKIIEVYGQQIQPCFWIIAQLNSLKYANLNCSDMLDLPEDDSNKNLGKRLNSEFSVDQKELGTMLDLYSH